MPAQRTVLRNTGVFTQALAQGKKVKFKYTDKQGVTSTRTVKPVLTEKTRHNADALIVKAADGLNLRSFRTDRATHARLVD
jgi:predicted DNA-binding transcriptional regulator YafY